MTPELKIKRTPTGKALYINQDPQFYGTFAEIGAGQEVARYFFQAGKASQTIAKTISAYDMIYSDEIYGKEASGRYVCESRLDKMLTKEFGLLNRRLDKIRGEKTCFFAYANTVATGGTEKKFCHGWMGVRFQLKPGGALNEISLHVTMLDRLRLQQQEALGILGVNLCYAAFYAHDSIQNFLDIIVDDIKDGRMAIDLIKVSGPDLAHIDHQDLNIELVMRGLAFACLFTPDGQAQHIGDLLFGKSILLQRGNFSPLTSVHEDILVKGEAQHYKEHKLKPLTMLEMVANSAQNSSLEPLKKRLQSLNQKNHSVLISNFKYFYELKHYIRKYTDKPVSLLMNAKYLDYIFSPDTYKNLEGGMLEGLGRLLEGPLKLYIYPHKTKELCVTLSTFHPQADQKEIFNYFIRKQQIVELADCDTAVESVD